MREAHIFIEITLKTQKNHRVGGVSSLNGGGGINRPLLGVLHKYHCSPQYLFFPALSRMWIRGLLAE